MSLLDKLAYFNDDETNSQADSCDQSTELGSRRSRSESFLACDEEDSYDFPESLYDDIEDFLDAEGLFITSQSPCLSQTILRPISNLKGLRSLIFQSSEHSDAETPNSENEAIDFTSIPSFMIKRAAFRKISVE